MPKFKVVVTHCIPTNLFAIAALQKAQRLSGSKIAMKKGQVQTRLEVVAISLASLELAVATVLFAPAAVVGVTAWQPATDTVKEWTKRFGRKLLSGEQCARPILAGDIATGTAPDADTVFLWRLEAAPQANQDGMLY